MKQDLWIQLSDKNGIKRSINLYRVQYIEDNCNGTSLIVFDSGGLGILQIALSYDAVVEQIQMSKILRGRYDGVEETQSKP
jgi:hypothetical protein